MWTFEKLKVANKFKFINTEGIGLHTPLLHFNYFFFLNEYWQDINHHVSVIFFPSPNVKTNVNELTEGVLTFSDHFWGNIVLFNHVSKYPHNNLRVEQLQDRDIDK